MKKAIFFEITDKCNEDCIHCDKKWRTKNGNTMDRDMLNKILKMPKDHLTISGGEPAMAKAEVKYIIENSKEPVSLNTNLVLWTKEELSYFKDKNVDLNVSVVSLDRDSYKKITGKDLVHKLKHNLDLINKESNINIVIDDYNINEIEFMVDYLTVRGFCSFTIQPAIPSMGDTFDSESYKKRLAALENVYDKHKNINIRMLCFYNHSSHVPVNHLCGAGKNRLVILSNGDVVPCACMPPIILGNIMKNSYQELETAGDKFYNSFAGMDQITCKGFLLDEKVREKNARKKC